MNDATYTALRGLALAIVAFTGFSRWHEHGVFDRGVVIVLAAGALLYFVQACIEVASR